MYGDVTSGDTTHQDVVLSYQSHFQNAHRDLPKVFNAQTKEAKFEEWKRASKIVEQSFDENKEEIISEMIKKLKIALETPPPTDKPLDSSTSDLYKAFTVYLKKNKSEILNDDEVEQFIDIPQECGTKDYELAMAYFARDVIINLDPEDYHSFIVEGRKRPKNYPQEASGSAEAISKAKIEAEKKSKCHACKKRFELDKGESPTYHLGYYWHPFHYRCFSCHKEVDKDFLYYKNNRSSYCSCCYCWGCNKPIGGDKAVVTKQLQGQYHKKCLTVLC
ncbi:PREDICTED: uncharacterized protein LOC109590597 [Amphimedon queenslandica]|nr:PREDICTED: uncharacterized protein LOC109590597 [Amphimedon queenslandica]|eukprot:XP_019862053.1 PREDICTED: uncharacterized protein LOC109590597 [Amphimedon queenslandica]